MMEFPAPPLRIHDLGLVDLSRCEKHPWYANIRIQKRGFRFEAREDHPRLRAVSVVAEESPNRYNFVTAAKDDQEVAHIIHGCLGSVFVLSLLDVAILSGDWRKARVLCAIGVQQRCNFRPYLFCNPVTGVADNRTERVLHTAKLCSDLCTISWAQT